MSSKFKLKLLRGGEDTDTFPDVTLEEFTEEMVFTRPSFIETVNDIKVQYVIREDG